MEIPEGFNAGLLNFFICLEIIWNFVFDCKKQQKVCYKFNNTEIIYQLMCMLWISIPFLDKTEIWTALRQLVP